MPKIIHKITCNGCGIRGEIETFQSDSLGTYFMKPAIEKVNILNGNG